MVYAIFVDAPITTSARLNGNGHIELDSELFPHGKVEQSEETISLTIRTDHSDGLILWHGQEPHIPGHGMDFIMLALENGHLIYRYIYSFSVDLTIEPILFNDLEQYVM